MKDIKIKTKLIIGGLICLLIVMIGYVGCYFLNQKDYKYTETKTAESYKELYSLVKKMNTKNKYDFLFGFIPIRKGILKNEMGENIDPSNQNNTDTGASGRLEYSDTNLQVLGVQEADIIKTDGEYIYALSTEYLYIIKSDNGKLSVSSKIKHHDNSKDKTTTNFSEIYINDDKLIGMQRTATYKYYDNGLNGQDIMPRFDYYIGSSDEVISAVIFNIKDKTKPVKINTLSQTGNYVSSRMIDNYLYIITNYFVYDSNLKREDMTTYIPSIKTDDTKPINPEDIYIVPNPKTSQYITVSGIDINNASDFVSSKAILGCGNNVYASTKNLFITSYDTITEKDYVRSKTNIIKFSIDKGVIALKATGSVNGSILNQFSMDESDEYFRIVTTSYDYKIISSGNDNDATTGISINNDDSKNNLYILDKKLKVVGKIEDVAKGERVYSVRFDKDIAYFVTFKQVDPLFAVDLSNPLKPKILGSLKIPGFSEYLHVYDGTSLFGLGKETDAEGRVLGMKLSMFDTSDKTNIKEKFKLFLGDKYTWSEASYNHKAILVSSNKAIIGFPANNSYLIYRYDNKNGFTKLHEMSFDDNDYYYGNIRGLYIGDYIYIYNVKHMKSYDIFKFNLINDLSL